MIVARRHRNVVRECRTMIRTFIVAGSAVLFSWSLAAQELGTVEIVSPASARHYYDLCQSPDAWPACGLRGIADHYCAIRMQSVQNPPCCIADSGSTNAKIRSSFLDWAEEHPDRLDDDVNTALREALSRHHPCTPELLATIPAFGENFLFPAGSLSEDARKSGFLNDWWSRQLIAMEEGALALRADEGIEIYRMLVVPSFSPSYTVRIEHAGNLTTAEFRKSSGAGGYDPGTLVNSERFEVSEAQWTQLSELLGAAELFRAPVEQPGGIKGTDGTMWVLEGVRDGRYQVVHRRPPGGRRGLGGVNHLIHAMVNRPFEIQHVRIMREWERFKRILVSMEEPLLYDEEGNDTIEAYRLVALSDTERPFAVRIQRDADGTLVMVRQISGTAWRSDRSGVVTAAQDFDANSAERSAFYRRTGILTESRGRSLGDADWRSLQALVERSGFWTSAGSRGAFRRDTDLWIIEGLRSGIYDYVVLRPNEDDAPEIFEHLRDLVQPTPIDQPTPIESTREGLLRNYRELRRHLLDYAEGLQ